jgi:hypothetical protein
MTPTEQAKIINAGKHLLDARHYVEELRGTHLAYYGNTISEEDTATIDGAILHALDALESLDIKGFKHPDAL